MTTASLREKPVRDLARLAKQHGVSGWHSMRKDQLIRALVKKAKSRSAAPAATLRPSAVAGSKTASRRGPGTTKQADRKGLTKAERDAVVARRLRDAREKLAKAKNLSTGPESGKPGRRHRDRVVLMVRGPHWLHAFWEVTPRSIARAEAALGQEWHSAKPVLRMLQIESGSQASPAERPVRDIPIHGGVKNWFIDIRDRITCRVEIGYKTSSGRFHALGRSNVVSTPAASQGDTLDVHWGEIADDCEKIYALSGGFSSENNSTELQELFEERLKRRLGPPAARRAGPSSEEEAFDREGDFLLQVDAEMVVYGVAKPGAYVTLQGEPVRVQDDGTFRVRLEMPDRRQVLPIVASTADGVGEQTIVLAVERNTKVMEPCNRDAGDL